MEVFSWLLKNGTNKADVDGVETKVLMQPYWRLGGPRGAPIALPTLQRPKQARSIYPSLEEFKKSEGQDYNEEPDKESPGGVGVEGGQAGSLS